MLQAVNLWPGSGQSNPITTQTLSHPLVSDLRGPDEDVQPQFDFHVKENDNSPNTGVFPLTKENQNDGEKK